MNKKIIIFDASTLITLAMNGMFEEIKGLKKIFKGNFIITKEVKKAKRVYLVGAGRSGLIAKYLAKPLHQSD